MAKTTRLGGATNKAVAPIVTYPQSSATARETPAAPEPEPDAPPSEYEAFTVEELRAELRGRELSASGNKAELVARLAVDDAEEVDSDGDG